MADANFLTLRDDSGMPTHQPKNATQVAPMRFRECYDFAIVPLLKWDAIALTHRKACSELGQWLKAIRLL